MFEPPCAGQVLNFQNNIQISKFSNSKKQPRYFSAKRNYKLFMLIFFSIKKTTAPFIQGAIKTIYSCRIFFTLTRSVYTFDLVGERVSLESFNKMQKLTSDEED